MPFMNTSQARFIRHIFKLPVPFINIKLTTSLVGSKKYIRFPVIVHVPDSNTTAVIEIPVFENIEIFGICNCIVESNTCSVKKASFETTHPLLLEFRCFFLFTLTKKKKENKISGETKKLCGS